MCVSLFKKKITFPYLKAKKEKLGYPEKQDSLIIMDTFKDQGDDEIRKLCSNSECELLIATHNVTNKFHSLGITINQKDKKFISHKLNTCYRDCVSYQLKRGVATGTDRLSLRMSDLKPMRARWIAEMHDYLKQQKGFMLNVIYKVVITRTVKPANEVFTRIENPLQKSKGCRLFLCSFVLTEENHRDFKIYLNFKTSIFFLFLKL